MIDQTTEGGKALQAVVKTELKSYLGKDYDDDVLPLYIVVMLAHGNQQTLVADNLDAFLGDKKAALFAEWLFKHLEENPGKYDAPEAKPAEPAEPEAVIEEKVLVEEQRISPEPVAEEDNGRKRRREKREKIEWKGEPEEKVRPHREVGHREERDGREEKRRKSRDEDTPVDRHDRGHDRDWDSRRPGTQDGRDAEGGRLRHESKSRQGEREGDRNDRRHRRDESNHRSRKHDRDSQNDRRDERTARPSAGTQREDRPSDSDRAARTGSRLAGRIGLPGSLTRPARPRSVSPTPQREEARPSVFDRLTSGNDQRVDSSRTRMRMDSVPADQGDDVYLDSGDGELPTTPARPILSDSRVPADELASELRLIRESLAKLQADKAEAASKALPVRVHSDTLLAALNNRKAVIHNVHFNASPDILKAHFSGCGLVVSGIIEKDIAGNPKGVAVVEFEDELARRKALTLSGSLLLGRPITVYAKESAPKHVPSAFRAPMSGFRPRAPTPGRGTPGRGFGRGAFPGRTTLKNNKYVRPQSAQPQEANTGA